MSNIKSGVILSYFIIIFNIVLGLLYTPWMIEKIGRADYGLYVLVTSFLAYFTVDYGLWQVINRLVAEQHIKKDIKRQNEIISVASSLYLFFDLCIFIILFAIYYFIEDIYGNLSAEEIDLFKTLYIIASIFAVLTFPFLFLKGVYMAKEMFVPTKIFDIIKRCTVILVTMMLLYLDYGVMALVVAYGLTPFIVSIIELLYLFQHGIRIRIGFFSKDIAKTIITLSIWLFLIVVGELFITNISPSILASTSNTEQIAIFAIGLSLYTYVYTFAGAINGFFFPKIFRMEQNDSSEEIVEVSRNVSAIQMFVVGCLVMCIICVGKSFIKLWVGESFLDSYWVVVFLIVPSIVTFCQPIESTQLFAKDKIKYRSIMMILTALSSVVISLFLCPKHGAVGAAIAICISNLIFMVIGMNIVYHIVLKRNLKYFLQLLIRYLIVLTMTLLIYKVCSASIAKNSWSHLFLCGLICSGLFVTLAYIIALPKSVKTIYFRPIWQRLFAR